jgi:hypothetical protein
MGYCSRRAKPISPPSNDFVTRDIKGVSRYLDIRAGDRFGG